MRAAMKNILRTAAIFIHVVFVCKAYCEVGYSNYQENCFILSASAGNWHNVEAQCENLGGTLAIITDGTMNGWVSSIFTGIYWIGANDLANEGKWEYPNREQIVYSNWNPGQPDNSRGEHCAQILTYGKWNDAPCSVNIRGICQTPELTASPTSAPTVQSGPSYDLVGLSCSRDATIQLRTKPLQIEDYYIKIVTSNISLPEDGCNYTIPAINKGLTVPTIEYPVTGSDSCGTSVSKSSDGLNYKFQSIIKVVYEVNRQHDYMINIVCTYPTEQVLSYETGVVTPGDETIDIAKNGTWGFEHSFYDSKGRPFFDGKFVETGEILTFEVSLTTDSSEVFSISKILGRSSPDRDTRQLANFYDRASSLKCASCIVSSESTKTTIFKLPMYKGLDELEVTVEIELETVRRTLSLRRVAESPSQKQVTSKALRGNGANGMELNSDGILIDRQVISIKLPKIVDEFDQFEMTSSFQSVMISSFVLTFLANLIALFACEYTLLKSRERLSYFTVIVVNCIELLGIVGGWYWLDRPTERCGKLLTVAWSMQLLLTTLLLGTGFVQQPTEELKYGLLAVQVVLDVIEIGCLAAVEAYCEDGVGPAVLRVLMFVAAFFMDFGLINYHWSILIV